MKSITFNAYSQEDLNKLIKEKLDENNEFLFKELDKLRERINNLEDLIRIYEGRIKLEYGKDKKIKG